MTGTTLNHPDAPDLNFKWNGMGTIRVRRFGREVDRFEVTPESIRYTRADALRAINVYVKSQP